jgi:hypothetical protein
MGFSKLSLSVFEFCVVQINDLTHGRVSSPTPSYKNIHGCSIIVLVTAMTLALILTTRYMDPSQIILAHV